MSSDSSVPADPELPVGAAGVAPVVPGAGGVVGWLPGGDDGDGPAVTLVGLADDLTPGEYVDVTFTFEEAGEVTVPVPVGISARDLPRGEPFDFHEGEGEGEGAGQQENPASEEDTQAE